MQVDLTLSIAKVYDIDEFDVMIGEKFLLEIVDRDDPVRWFSDNDPVLSIKGTGNSVDIEATELGTSTILIMNPQNNDVNKTITIKVIDKPANQAVKLNLSAGDAISK